MSTSMVEPLPGWVPDHVRVYLAHVVGGEPIRALARQSGCHASTVLRQVRRCEQRRDDPLIDLALKRLGQQRAGSRPSAQKSGADTMTTNTETTSMPSEEVIALEARRILRRLSEPGACLAVAEGMEKAVVVRETKDGQTIRTGVCDSKVAEALALKEWIAASGTGRIARYRIKPAGRSALKHLLAEEGETGEADAGTHAKAPPTARYNHFESPLLTLARRRDKDGELFLSDALVRAGERMREDFELARMSAGGERDWHEFLLSAGSKDTAPDIEPLGTSPEAAGRRLADALTDLGPGLGDVVLRVCCHLEGMETVERRMGWAARSGKIVLRIGLQRLQRHYLERYGNLAPMIG